MLDRLLNSALWLVVMGLISLTAIFSLLLGFRGLFNVCAGRYPAGGLTVMLGVILAGGSFLLCRYCNDLMDR
jgi:hypothetical protein